MKILNKQEVDEFINSKMQEGHNVYGVKGPAHAGMTYEDGTPVTNMVNIAWRCSATGEQIEIKYGE